MRQMDIKMESCQDVTKKDFNKFIVIADDYTGSNDCGVQLKNRGLSAVTVLSKGYLNDIYGYDVIVMDSETRSMTKENSCKAIKEIGTNIKGLMGSNIVFKKIDSTLRGYIGIEIEALDNVLNPELIVFAPAYPKNNRTTVHGIHYFNGVPIDKTELSKDPKNPIVTSNIKKILETDSDLNFLHVQLESIRNNEIHTILNQSNSRCFSFDGEVDGDLDIIVKQVLSLNKKVLWVGSAGLIDSIINMLSPVAERYNPVLAVVGSINSTSAAQAQEAMEDEKVFGLKIDIESVILSPEKEKNRILTETIMHMDAGSDVLLATALESDQVVTASCLSKSLGLTLNEISSKIADFMGSAVYEILRFRRISGMFLTGGDTAINVINKLSAKGSVLVREIELGVPLVSLFGGPYEGLPIITKAGAFGKLDTIKNSISFLRNRASNS